jgi:hypothetical protein
MICAYEECSNKFEPKTHNQKYCSDECCRIATNKKLKDQYYAKKARLSGVIFRCSKRGCSNILSRYSTGDVCDMCMSKEKTQERNSIINMLKDAGMA